MPVHSRVITPVLHAFGSNGSGQLGIGHLEDVSTPQRCSWQEGPQPSGMFRSIASGGNHTLIFYDDGRIYGAGDNTESQLDSSDAPGSVFRQIVMSNDGAPVERFSFVAATWTASTFVAENGSVFVRGSGPKGELGLGPGVESLEAEQLLAGFPPPGTQVSDLRACMSHTIAVLSTGDVYGWGNGRKGQLGSPAEVVWRPRKLQVPFKARKAACGRDFTVVAAPPEDGRLIIFGSDKYSVVSSAPASIGGWDHLEASWCSMHVLINGRLTSWGRQDKGQLLGNDIPNVERFAAGSEHVLAKLKDGRIMAWGWGEHGNCGPDQTEDSAHEVNRVDGFCVLGAGCATSFIAIDT